MHTHRLPSSFAVFVVSLKALKPQKKERKIFVSRDYQCDAYRHQANSQTLMYLARATAWLALKFYK